MESPPPPAALPFTGERFVPGVRGEIWVEHWHRYHFAAQFAKGMRVVDAACGEGYGSALLARDAASVVGADISPEAVAHARAAYAGTARLSFVQAPCTKLPLPDESADLFVSFETVEHILEQEEFLDEIARVLAPDGILLLSCPNKREYSDRRDYRNEFHVKELYRDELAALVARRFRHARWYGQRPSFFSVIAPEPRAETGHFAEVAEACPAEDSSALDEPLYFLVAASRSMGALGMLPAMLSVFADRDNWLHRDYEKVIRHLETASAQLHEMAGHVDSLAKAREEAMKSRDEALAWAGQLESRVSHLEREVSEQSRGLAERDREIDRRAGLAWWLRLPLLRLLGRRR